RAVTMRPQPTGRFAWVQATGGPALVCRPLEAFAPHLFTTRRWPLGSTPNGDSAAAWLDVAAAVGVDLSHLARLHQVHGAHVVVAQRSLRPDGDVVVSDDPDVALAIQTADCVPLLIVDARTRASAAAHAGWRGPATRDQVAAAGVSLDRIHIAEVCTASHPEYLCSYRRDGTGAGRMAAAIRPATRS